MKLIFTSDYVGRETAMKEYKEGQTDDFGIAQALDLIKLGVALEVEEIERKPKRRKEALSDTDTS